MNRPQNELFSAYADHINAAYPGFLARMGYGHRAKRAKGCWITASNGNRYLDCISGYGLFSLGHHHPEIVSSLRKTLEAEPLLTRPLIVKEQVDTALDLNRICPGELSNSFMCNSGSEAVDTAIKLARFHTGKSRIVCAEKSFHGYTFGALSASGIEAFKSGFRPLVPDMVHAAYGDPGEIEKLLDENTAAVLLEPVQHEAGITVPPADYFQKVKKMCEDCGALLILDEIKTGLGRTGRMFGCDHFDVVPDVMVLGKTLGGGLLPAGAVVASKKIWKRTGYSFSLFASSFAGNTLVCAVASAVLHVLEKDGIVQKCHEKGRYFYQGLKELKQLYPGTVKQVSGKGLLLSVTTASAPTALNVIRTLSERRILTAPAFGDPGTVMIEPPLVIEFQDIDRVLAGFEAYCKKAVCNE